MSDNPDLPWREAVRQDAPFADGMIDPEDPWTTWTEGFNACRDMMLATGEVERAVMCAGGTVHDLPIDFSAMANQSILDAFDEGHPAGAPHYRAECQVVRSPWRRID
jgi:hypothetical protein